MPERIRAARELLGLSQAQLAAAAGLSQGLISQLENGNRPETEEVLAAIVEGTGLPPRFFTRDPDPLPSESLRFRKYRSAPVRATARARRTFIELADVATVLMRSVDSASAALPIAPDAETHSHESIEHLAEETRALLGVAVGKPIGHLTRVLERAYVPVAPIVFADLSGEEQLEVAAIGHFGLSARAHHNGWPLIGYFPSAGDRQRFTLAHELGHLVLHGRSSTEASTAEREADVFAGALLFPRSARSELRESATLRDFALLKATWGVSIQALVMRAYQLSVIDNARKVSLYKQISARGWRHNEPVIVRAEEPMLLGTLLARNFGTGAGAYVRAAHELGLPAVLLRSVARSIDAKVSRDAPVAKVVSIER